MTEVGRFFDAISYGEADQAEVQNRFRNTGVLPEVAGQLLVTAPGGMFVTVAAGEAMVEGFHYKNTAPIALAIANNSSGSQRIDRVVLRLNRTGNSLAVAILQGTPGGGVPALTQLAGGTYELLLADITVNTGVLAISDDLILNYTTFSGLFFDNPRPNLLDNPTCRVNQRNNAAVTGASGYVVDRWFANIVAGGYYQSQPIGVYPPNMGYVTPETSRCIYNVRTANTADGTTTYQAIQQTLTGDRAQPMYGQPVCLSWWTYSTRAGIIAANIDLGAAPMYRYIIRYAHSKPNAWQYHWVTIPWNGAVGLVNGSAAALTVRFIQVAGSSYRHSSHNAWFDQSLLAAKSVGPDFSSIIQSTSDTFWIYQPKLEIGTYPTRFEAPDPMLELLQCYRQLYVEREQVPAWIGVSASAITGLIRFPTEMRVAPSMLLNQAPTMSNAVAPTANQLGVLAHSSWLGSMTYASWALWVTNGKLSASTYLSLSTGPAGVAAGDSALIVLGSNMQAIFSSEL